MSDILLEPKAQAPAATQVTHVDALPVGTRLAEFEIQGLLGVGGFGMVYRAYDHSLHRPVAIKEYMPAALAGRVNGTTVSVRSSADTASYQSGLQSFVGEARLLAQFDHPSLVKVYRFWEANNTAYMVMPLYSGVTLKQARSQMSSPPSEEWLRTVLWSVLQGLHVLHRNDTLHRDISPDNIFLQDVGPPVLLDLGASRRAITDKSQKMTAVLKVNYAPIEQYAEVDDLKQGPWTDLYAVAAVVYTMMRNDPPPPATTRAVRDGMPTVRSVAGTVKAHFGVDYSDKFVRAISHALAVQPADRPQSLAAFVTEMKLKAPPRLSKFDWRAELGASLSTEDEGNSRQFQDTRAQTTPLAAIPPELKPGAAKDPRGAGARRIVRVAAWTAAVLALLIAGVQIFDWGTRDTPLVAAPAPGPMPEPAVVPPTPSDEPSADGASPDAGAVPAAAPDASQAGTTPPADAANGPPVAPVAAAPAVAPAVEKAPEPKVEPKVEPKPPVHKPKPRPQPRHVAPKPAPAAASTAKAAAPVEAPAAPPPVLRRLCPDANFFTRPMCIHLECQKPENAQRPVCIEDRKRYPNN